MSISESDHRSVERRALDEQIASAPKLAIPESIAEALPSAVENHLGRLPRQPLAIAGVVANGLVRPLNPAVRLTENARVIIVTAEAS